MLAIYRLAIGVVAGLGMLLFGALALTDSAVTCGGDAMRPGDICTTIRRGITTVRTYEQQKASNGRVGLITTAAGPVVLLASGALLMGALRKRRSSPEPAGAGAFRA